MKESKMKKILLKKITNILDINKEAEYINFSDSNQYINLKDYIEIEKFILEKKIKHSFELCINYKSIINELKKIDNYNDFNTVLENHEIPILFERNIPKKNTKSNKKDKSELEEVSFNSEEFKNTTEEFYYQKNDLLKKIEKFLLKDLEPFKLIKKTSENNKISTGKMLLKIGFNFINGKLNGNEICAPTFFRSIELEINDNEIKIISLSEKVEFNEKLWIFINKELEREITEDKKIFSDFSDFKKSLESLLNYEIKEENNIFSEIIKNEFKKKSLVIKYADFFILSLFDIDSGKIKDDFLELMENDEKDIFSIDMKNDNEFYSKEEFKQKALIQINNPLNIYQKYAVRSAMNENTIIYGPPGTGKSEIITSIVANLIMQSKNLIVVSEKSAALDVIKSRLGKLTAFAFYLKDLDNEKIIYEQIENISDQMGSFYNDEYKNESFDLEDAFNKNDRVVDYNVSIKKFRDILQESIDFSLKRDSRGNDYKEYLLSINMIDKFVKQNKDGVEIFWNEYRDKYVKLQSPTEFISKVAEYNWFKNTYNIMEEEINKYDEMRNNLTNFLVENNFINYTINNFDNINEKVEEFETFLKDYMLHKDNTFLSELESNPNFLIKNYKIMQKINTILEPLKNKKSIVTFLFKNLARHDKFLTKLSTLTEGSRYILTERYYLKNEILVKRGLFSKKINNDTLDKIIESIKEFNELKTFKTNTYLKELYNKKNEMEDFFSPIIIYFHQHKHLLKQNFIDFYNKKIIIFDLRIIKQYYKYRVNKIERELINISNYNFEIASKYKIIIDRNIPELIKTYLKNNQDFILNMDSALYNIYISYIKNKLSKSTKEIQDKCSQMIKISRMEKKPKINEFITEFLDCLLIIFPIWISKPNLISQYIDLKEKIFDVGIFDEASQMFLEKAYPILYRCKYVIISGDDKQLKPERLIFNEYKVSDSSPIISDIQFNESESLLDRARVSYWNTYTLKNHYRSLAKELIEFSNTNFYDDKLLFATENNNEIKLPIEIINVDKKAKDSNKINKEEASSIIKRLKLEDTKLNSNFKKILVICFTKEQKDYIENKILTSSMTNTFSSKIKSGNIVIKDISSVQGDEGDLVLISVVYTKNDDDFGLMEKPRGSNYLNVAITRSKSKIVIYKSITKKDLTFDSSNKNEDLEIFKKWINYLDNKLKKTSKSDGKSDGFENGDLLFTNFKKDIFQKIKENKIMKKFEYGINIKLGSETVDIAVYSKSKDKSNILLLIILDDWKKNINISDFFQDIDKEEYLMSRKYKVIRILETDWLKDSEGVIQYLENVINYLETPIAKITKTK